MALIIFCFCVFLLYSSFSVDLFFFLCCICFLFAGIVNHIAFVLFWVWKEGCGDIIISLCSFLLPWRFNLFIVLSTGWFFLFLYLFFELGFFFFFIVAGVVVCLYLSSFIILLCLSC
jgi:hypothetical protein